MGLQGEASSRSLMWWAPCASLQTSWASSAACPPPSPALAWWCTMRVGLCGPILGPVCEAQA